MIDNVLENINLQQACIDHTNRYFGQKEGIIKIKKNLNDIGLIDEDEIDDEKSNSLDSKEDIQKKLSSAMIKESIIFSVDCSIAWQDNVETTGCVTRSLILNGWISLNASMAMSPDDQRALLMGSLNQFLNGSFHTIVELSARFVPRFSVNYKIKRTAAD